MYPYTILKFGAKNFYSFKEGFELSFELGAGCPETISKGEKVAHAMCVKGANASGKTNVLKALCLIAEFCSRSFRQPPDEELHFRTHFDNEKPTEFFVDFETQKYKYFYEGSVTSKVVLEEKLYRKSSEKRSKKVLMFERNREKIEKRTSEFKDLDSIKIRSNASIISTAHHYQITPLEEVYEFFNFTLSNVHKFGLNEKKQSPNFITEYLHNHKDSFDFVSDILKTVDPDLIKIEILERNDGDQKKYIPIFVFHTEYGPKPLHFYAISSGTKSLYLQLCEYHLILKTGGVLILDEFDINLHPHILPMLVDLFDNPERNALGAQLLFTTHNSQIMEKMGKYRTFLVNKENSESYAYRLDELPGELLRNDRPITPIYESGKIGGTPRL